MNALARLIQQRKQELSLSTRDISERSEGSVSVALLGKWLWSDKLDGIPRTNGINGLATALDLPPIRVLLAAAEAAGMDITDPSASDVAGLLPAQIDELPPGSRKLLVNTAWHLLRLETKIVENAGHRNEQVPQEPTDEG